MSVSRWILVGSLVAMFAPATSRGDDGSSVKAATRRGPDIVRATVQLRKGDGRGSGTVIASEPGMTLVLTAAHVVKDGSDLKVELHRHNLGIGAPLLTEGGGWPRLVPAVLVEADAASDVALVKIEGMTALRHVARIDPAAKEPVKGETLTSVGIDRGRFLTRWRTRIEGLALVDIGLSDAGSRPYLVTTRHPEHGRSGGGLFREDGTVVGLCTGMLSLEPGRPKVGLFASTTSVLGLLRKYGVGMENGNTRR